MRWALLIRATGYPLKTRDSTEIIFISWFVNCLVPAKLGDIYRAYLLQAERRRVAQPDVRDRRSSSGSWTCSRSSCSAWPPASSSFRGRLPTDVQIVFAIGVAVIVILAVLLLTLRNFGRRLLDPPADPRAGPSSCTTGSRKASSRAVGVRQVPILAVPDRR